MRSGIGVRLIASATVTFALVATFASTNASASHVAIQYSSTLSNRTAPSLTNPFSHAIDVAIAKRPGKTEAAIYDFRTGHLWTLGPQVAQPEASVIKVEILAALLRKLSGALPSARVQSIAKSMIEESDNTSATELWDADGGTKGLEKFDREASLSHTTPAPCLHCFDFNWPGWGLSTTTPSDEVKLLSDLVRPGSLFTTKQRRFELGLMAHVVFWENWGVGTTTRYGAHVDLKNGWVPLSSEQNLWQINSVGWVTGKSNNYLLVMFSANNPTENDGINTEDWLAEKVWSRLSAESEK
jgi:hypothetical protein